MKPSLTEICQSVHDLQKDSVPLNIVGVFLQDKWMQQTNLFLR